MLDDATNAKPLQLSKKNACSSMLEDARNAKALQLSKKNTCSSMLSPSTTAKTMQLSMTNAYSSMLGGTFEEKNEITFELTFEDASKIGFGDTEAQRRITWIEHAAAGRLPMSN